MENVLSIVSAKACSVVALALGVALAGRYLKRPAVVHVLWIVVLLELLVPPVFEIGVLPRVELPESEAAPLSTVAGPPVPIPGGVLSFGTLWTVGALAIWLAGSLGVTLLTAVRIRRFRQLLTDTTDAPAPLQAVVARLSARLGLSRAPRIRLVPASISPMLWPGFGSLEILFPAPLLELLDAAERDTLLAHELAHVRRKDHWVRYLEVTAGVLFWWHPVVWWARSRLREVEEQCCDGLVLRTLPGHARDYAQGLVKTVEFLAGARTGLPSLASGVGDARILKGRLAMILKHRSSKILSGPGRLGLALVAAGLLLVVPTWADRTPEENAELRAQEQELAPAEAMVRAGVLDLERQAQILERELHEVRTQQQELQHSLRLQYEELSFQRMVERQLVKAEASKQRGDLERAAEIAAQAAKMKEIYLVMRETRERELELSRRTADLTRDQAREEIEALLEAGELERAREAERELAEALVHQELEEQRRKRADKVRFLRQQVEGRTVKLQEAEAEGHHDEAARHERGIGLLRQQIERMVEAEGAD